MEHMGYWQRILEQYPRGSEQYALALNAIESILLEHERGIEEAQTLAFNDYDYIEG